MQTVNDIRSAFLDFFGPQGQEVVPSRRLVARSAAAQAVSLDEATARRAANPRASAPGR
ncbi:MAG TPA: hypothetical protein VHG92_04155 [Afifellaceae bacterium]|nr:hypothetical protein [Afifellaceae bacterium]